MYLHMSTVVGRLLGHVNAHLCQDDIHQLALRQREVGVVVTRQDIAEQQCHPYLGQGSHAGAHDPHPPPCNGPGEILPRYAQQLGDGFLIETVCLAPPLAEFTLLVFLQNQRVAQELADGICIKGDPVTPHP